MRPWINQPFVLVLIGLHLVPGRTFAGDDDTAASPETPVVRDVELGVGGVVSGLVLDAEGQPVAEAVVELHKDNTVLLVTTDKAGQLSVEGLTGGACVVKTGETNYACRFWAHGSAPPNALTGFAIVHHDEDVVRGQSRRSLFSLPKVSLPKGHGFLHPFAGFTKAQLIALGLLTAGATVAIVLAVQDDGDSSN